MDDFSITELVKITMACQAIVGENCFVFEHSNELSCETIPKQFFVNRSCLRKNTMEPNCPTTATGSSTSLQDLPDKCLANVFKQIPPAQLDDISQVCRRWDKVIQGHVGLEIWASDLGFRFGYRIFENLTEMENFIVEVFRSRVITEMVPPLKRPDALLELEFSMGTLAENFRTLTFQSVNLKSLKFGFRSLGLEFLNNVELRLPNLRTLDISDDTYVSREKNGIAHLATNIIYILRQTFPSLSTLIMNVSATHPLMKVYGMELLQFLHRHAQTLKTLRMCNSFQLWDNSTLARTEETVISLSEYQAKSIELGRLASLRLEDLHLDMGNFFLGVDEWKKILKNQDQLKNLNFVCSVPLLPLNVSLPAVTLSSRSLQRIELGAKISPGEDPVDCGAFADCQVLKILGLYGKSSEGEEDPVEEVSNVDRLPSSIEQITMKCLRMKTDSINHLLFGLPVLKKISIEKAGDGGDFGITLEQVEKVFETLQLQEFQVRQVNKKGEEEVEKRQTIAVLQLKPPLKSATFRIRYFERYSQYLPITDMEDPHAESCQHCH